MPFADTPVAVTTAAQAAARDASATADGIPPRALMRQAGAAAAAEIAHRFAHRLGRGVAVYAGAGNNGGDAWVVARTLAASGVRAAALAVIDAAPPHGGEEIVVDGILGTGAHGAPRGAIADGVRRVNALRANGAAVVALDVPSGLDATTGAAADTVHADVTLTFGTVKRGLLVARSRAGAIVVLDIGLGAHAALDDGAPALVGAAWVAHRLPPIAAEAHKGTRKKIGIVGGASGMAGATVMAARAALASGAGLVQVVAHADSIRAVQAAVPQALAAPWPGADDGDALRALVAWADALLIGPGLGRGEGAHALVERLLATFRGPVVLDADALNAFSGDAAALGALLHGRPSMLTPHATECARLAGVTTDHVLAHRFEIGADVARVTHAVVLLKGVPTIVSNSNGARFVSASGTPMLGTGGSGDILGGIAATLLAQHGDAASAAAMAAWVHGRAAEIVSAGRATRGTSLDDLLVALPSVWDERPPPPRAPVLAELPAVGDDIAATPSAT